MAATTAAAAAVEIEPGPEPEPAPEPEPELEHEPEPELEHEPEPEPDPAPKRKLSVSAPSIQEELINCVIAAEVCTIATASHTGLFAWLCCCRLRKRGRHRKQTGSAGQLNARLPTQLPWRRKMQSRNTPKKQRKTLRYAIRTLTRRGDTFSTRLCGGRWRDATATHVFLTEVAILRRWGLGLHRRRKPRAKPNSDGRLTKPRRDVKKRRGRLR